MAGAAVARGCIVDRARPRFGERHQVFDRTHRQRRVNDEQARRRRDQCDRRKILHRVVRQLAHQVWIDREIARLSDHQRVAVGRRFRRGVGAEHARRARAIVDHDLLAERFGEARA